MRATGEKTARPPVCSLTIVARPPTLNSPNRAKGELIVAILGRISWKTMTFAGSEGMSFAADLEVIVSKEDAAQKGFEVLGAMSVGEVCGAAI